ncbi:MAG: hypothetical protein IJY65_02470 [Clostridia bacterium]|nr:hypothetical protein [Clostridia bacterium]
MPFIDTKTTEKISDEQKRELTARLGEAIAIIPGKSERWLMLNFAGEQDMAFSGKAGLCAMVNVKLFGKASPDAYSRLTARICDIMNEVLSLPRDRVYVQYDECSIWGYNGDNF